MSYATHLIDQSTDPDTVLTAQQIIAAAGSGHTHSNKSILDEITSAFTTAQASKLSGIETAATADQTGSEIVSLIDTQLGSTVWQTGGSGGGGAAWGEITGTLSSQTDLQTVLDSKALTARTITAGTGLAGGGDLTANRSLALSSANVDKLASLTIATETLSVDRGLLIGLYDHTIASGEANAPPAGAIFRSTVDGRVYQRLADGSTNLLNNASSEYGEGGNLFLSTGTTNTPVIIQGVDGQAATLLQIKTHTGEITLTLSQNGDIATNGKLFCTGLIFEAALQTGDPGSPGVVWNDAGTLKVSPF